jgi:small conductance mechanosensitive channel
VTKAEITNRFWLFVGELSNTKTPLGQAFLALLFLLGAWLAGRALRLAVHRYLDRIEQAGTDPTAVRFLAQLANMGVYILAFAIYCPYNPTLDKLGTAWLASVGVVSVVVGLAAQSTLGNLISGISLVLYRPFSIGDRLQVNVPSGLEMGRVESINLGYTVLRTRDDRQLVIPNSVIAGQASIKLSQALGLCIVSVIVAPNTNLPNACKILTDVARANPKTDHTDECYVSALAAVGATLTLNATSKDWQSSAQLKSEILEAAQKQFEAAGIKLA